MHCVHRLLESLNIGTVYTNLHARGASWPFHVTSLPHARMCSNWGIYASGCSKLRRPLFPPLLLFLLSHSSPDFLVIHDWSMCCWTQVGCFYAKHFSEKTWALNDLWLRALWVWVWLCAFVCLGMTACVLTCMFAALLHHETSEIYNKDQHEHTKLEGQRLLLETNMQTMWTEVTMETSLDFKLQVKGL